MEQLPSQVKYWTLAIYGQLSSLFTEWELNIQTQVIECVAFPAIPVFLQWSPLKRKTAITMSFSGTDFPYCFNIYNEFPHNDFFFRRAN